MIDYEDIGAAVRYVFSDRTATNEVGGRAAVEAMIPAAVKGSCAQACPFNGRDFCGLNLENKYASTNRPGPSCPASKKGGGA